MTYGRRRQKNLLTSMPFHSTATKEEAENLVILHCRMGYGGRYLIIKTWQDQDIIEAMKSAALQFGLRPLECL